MPCHANAKLSLDNRNCAWLPRVMPPHPSPVTDPNQQPSPRYLRGTWIRDARSTQRPIPVWTLADRMRRAREHAGLEQRELAAKVGISRATVSNAERGVVVPRTATVQGWAKECGVDLGVAADGSAELRSELMKPGHAFAAGLQLMPLKVSEYRLSILGSARYSWGAPTRARTRRDARNAPPRRPKRIRPACKRTFPGSTARTVGRFACAARRGQPKAPLLRSSAVQALVCEFTHCLGAALENEDAIRFVLKTAVRGLDPFVSGIVTEKLPDVGHWSVLLAEKDARVGYDSASGDNGDVAPLLRMLTERLGTHGYLFSASMPRIAATYASELIAVRNAWAHLREFDDADTYRAVDTAERLLIAVGAIGEAGRLASIKQGLLHRLATAGHRADDLDPTQSRDALAAPLQDDDESPCALSTAGRQQVSPHRSSGC